MKPRKDLSILFLGKDADPLCLKASEFVKNHFPNSTISLNSRGEPFPNKLMQWKGDYIISYLCPWIVPKELLDNASIHSINFHPGSPKYPGIGCTNFAIYNGEKEFGVTCHQMNQKVDTGDIIMVKRFPIYEADSVLSLTQRCYENISNMFYDIMDIIISGQELTPCGEKWERPPYQRKELNELCKLNLTMSAEEMKRRVKAVTFPNAPGAYIEINGMKFEYVP